MEVGDNSRLGAYSNKYGIYASKKFWFGQNRPYLLTSGPSCWRMFDMHAVILTAVKIRLIKFSGSFWSSNVRKLRKLYFLKILIKVLTRASLLAFGVYILS